MISQNSWHNPGVEITEVVYQLVLLTATHSHIGAHICSLLAELQLARKPVREAACRGSRGWGSRSLRAEGKTSQAVGSIKRNCFLWSAYVPCTTCTPSERWSALSKTRNQAWLERYGGLGQVGQLLGHVGHRKVTAAAGTMCNAFWAEGTYYLIFRHREAENSVFEQSAKLRHICWKSNFFQSITSYDNFFGRKINSLNVTPMEIPECFA